MLFTCMLSTPTTRHPPPLDYVSRSMCFHLSPFTTSICPPFTTLGMRLVTCHPLGGSSIVGPSVYLVTLPCPPYFLFLLLVSSGSWFLVGWQFFARARVQGASNTCKSLSTVLSLPITWPCRRRSPIW